MNDTHRQIVASVTVLDDDFGEPVNLPVLQIDRFGSALVDFNGWRGLGRRWVPAPWFERHRSDV